ncbi:sialidase family protein [Foetidibacter luteolus]|uniref:sialidase family protein n=1 Tax=Foetidibacter luteolus TaxID=2608880 RepID=UPI00129AAD7C|nr:sialidase family protein [Foetidibacter luteolus]
MKKCLLNPLCLFIQGALFARPGKTVLFASGTEGYASFRKPAMVALPQGRLPAFCEGRVNNAGDFGNADILRKASNYNGKTWGSLQLVVDNGSLHADNPAPPSCGKSRVANPTVQECDATAV